MLIFLIAFICGYLDSGLGGGYGTALSPILILMGHKPLEVIPVVLGSQFMTDVVACLVHHRVKNVNLHFKSDNFKIAWIIGTVSLIGVVTSIFVAISVPQWILTLYIGTLVIAMGVLMLLTIDKVFRFSWKKIIALGTIASFNKGMSGGGFGPLLTGGQVLSGIDVKNVIGMTAFAKAMTCFVGFMLYFIMGKYINWHLIFTLWIGAIPAVIGAGFTVKYINTNKLKKYVAVFIIILGILTLFKIGGK
jgi:uncharacterized membrane protein YfcA